MDVIDVSLGWKQTITTEDLVIFLQSQENAAIWPLSILLSAFHFTFYHLYLFGLFQLWPHTYTTHWFGNCLFLKQCGFVCCDNGKSPNEYKLQYLCETIVRNIYDFPFHFISVPNISLHDIYFISWYKIVNLQTTGLVFKC